MTSLKHLLNFDHEDRTQWDRPGPAFPRGSDEETFSSDIPALEDHSWQNLFTGLFSSEHGPASFEDSPSRDDIIPVDLWEAEENMEAWAQYSLPVPQTPLGPTRVDSVDTDQEGFRAEVSGPFCYGMIYRSAVRLMGDMSQIETNVASAIAYEGAGHCLFGIANHESNVYLIFSNGLQLGILNTHTAKAVNDIIKLPSVQLEAHVNLSVLQDTIRRAVKAADATVRANIYVYGSRESRTAVGDNLSASKLYLQHPDQLRDATTYDNPHVLELPGMTISEQIVKWEGIDETKTRGEIADDFKQAISNVYARLKRSSRLNRLEGDTSVKTPLLPHQQEALDFMTQRETGPVPPEFSLWQAVEARGATSFRHMITKVETRLLPPETGGGILADEMGMGKTLSILSLIIRTLPEACAWRSSEIEKHGNIDSTQRQHSSATLVVVPSGLLVNGWLSQVETHLDGTLRVIKYHGQKRETGNRVLADSDIVLTTYHTLAADFAAKRSPVHEIAWYRIVLDEAHIIRRRATTLYHTVSELTSNLRWCLTGSPIQNKLEDIGALLTFIHASPFDSIATFRRFIAAPFDEGGPRRTTASERLGLLLDSICLRRSRSILDLPERRDRLRCVEFSEEERDQYESTKTLMIQALRQKVGEVNHKKIFGMFQAQLQLRILSNHGTFQEPFSWTDPHNVEMEQEDALCMVGQTGSIMCSSCKQIIPIMSTNRIHRKYTDRCAHAFCLECLDDIAQEMAKEGRVVSQCPMCCHPKHGGIHGLSAIPSRVETQFSHFRPQGHSSKMTALMIDVQQDLWESKSIIFSCWTRTLDLISEHLRRYSIPFERIDGDCPLTRRQSILDNFAANATFPVLIMTTGTGAYGLNIPVANRVFIVEPQWNPSVEEQAISRALRLGQAQSVLVTRYIVNHTVEQEMRSQQNRKLRLAEVGWEKSRPQL